VVSPGGVFGGVCQTHNTSHFHALYDGIESVEGQIERAAATIG